MSKNFEDTVKSMTAKEIIMSMVEGLQKPAVKVAMLTFGGVFNGVCYGCAATNAICKITSKSFTEDTIPSIRHRAKFLMTDVFFLHGFENAINELRYGCISDYNNYAEAFRFAKIKNTGIKLPGLTSDYTPADLQPYIELANAQ